MIDRPQPYCLGLDDNNELIWEVRQMPRWQMQMFPIHYDGPFRFRWMLITARQNGLDLDPVNMPLY